MDNKTVDFQDVVRLKWQEYRSILSHAELTDSDRAALFMLMPQLRLTDAELADDMATVAEVRRCRSIIQNAEQIESRLAEIRGKLKAHNAETLRLLDERERAGRSLIEQESRAVLARSGLQDAWGKLPTLRKSPRLYGESPRPLQTTPLPPRNMPIVIPRQSQSSRR